MCSIMGFPGGSGVKNLPANAGDSGSIFHHANYRDLSIIAGNKPFENEEILPPRCHKHKKQEEIKKKKSMHPRINM